MQIFARATLAALALAVTAVPAVAQNVEYQLLNQSSQTIYYFYTSPSNDENWGEDILGSQVLAPGETATVTIGDGSDQCLYDFLFESDTGATLEDYGVDICNLASYTVTD